MDPFCHGAAGQQTSIPTLRSSATPAKSGFHSGDVGLVVSHQSKDLDCVPREHVDHPFPRCLVQRVCDSKGSAQSGQNVRTNGGQNLRNPQAFFDGNAINQSLGTIRKGFRPLTR
jgi:hypothetical protein